MAARKKPISKAQRKKMIAGIRRFHRERKRTANAEERKRSERKSSSSKQEKGLDINELRAEIKAGLIEEERSKHESEQTICFATGYVAGWVEAFARSNGVSPRALAGRVGAFLQMPARR